VAAGVTRDVVDRSDVLDARAGDEAAFERLAAAVVDRLYRIAVLILRDGHQAEDAVQETLVRAWTGIAKLREPERFDAWLHRLLVHACADQSRGRRRFEAVVKALPADPPAVDDVSGVAERDAMERGFRRLSAEHRAVIVFHYYLDLPLHEIAETLGLPEGTVKSRLHHARQALRAGLEADARGAGATSAGGVR
jgi:RNA polymerase sigma-70 factor (ECF subfamily)